MMLLVWLVGKEILIAGKPAKILDASRNIGVDMNIATFVGDLSKTDNTTG